MTAGPVQEGQDEMARRWAICRAVGRWCRLRVAYDLPADPRKADWFIETMRSASLRTGEPTDTFVRRFIVLRAISIWMDCIEKRNGEAFDPYRFDTDADHSALLWWLFHGNELLPHVPPLRMSRPDHHMAATGKVRVFEVWRRPESGVDACVDQHTDGWKYVSGSEKEGRFVLDQKNWGRWEFVRGSEMRTSTTGRSYEVKWWDGRRLS